MFYKISSSVGSGKTQAVIEHIRDNLDKGYILVAPTIALCEEIYKRLLLGLVDHPHYANNGPIHLVVTEKAQKEGPHTRAEKVCKEYDKKLPPIVIVTTKTFEYLLDTLDDARKKRFAVFVDEGLPPIQPEQFSPGNKDDYLKYFSVDENQLAVAAPGQEEIVQWAAYSPKKLAGQQLDHLDNSSFREMCRLVLSPHYEAFLWQTEKSIEVLGVLSPEPLKAFHSVTLIVAIFERTLLPLLWHQRHGISFSEFPLGQELYDAHVQKGPKILIWHVLFDGDLPSQRNLNRNYETGDPNEQDERKKVIYEAARQIDQAFPDGSYCWAANVQFKNPDNVLSGMQMPTVNAGLDHYRHFDNVVSLVCINPVPWVKKRIMQLFELEDDQLYELWRFSHTYQTIGRCSVRVRERKNEIQMVVPSSFCAEQLAELFKGATVKGQLTKLPQLRHISKAELIKIELGISYTKNDNVAYSKYRKRCEAKGNVPAPKEEWFMKIRKLQLEGKG